MKSKTTNLLPYRGGHRHIHGKIKKNWNRARDVVQSPIDSAQATAEAFVEDVDDAAEELGEDIQGGLDDVEEAVEDFGEDLGDAAGGFIGDIWAWVKKGALWVAIAFIVVILLIVFLVKGIAFLFRGKKPAAGR